jgi:hypothetical protein
LIIGDDEKLPVSHSQKAELLQNISNLYVEWTIHPTKTFVDDSQNSTQTSMNIKYFRNTQLNSSIS